MNQTNWIDERIKAFCEAWASQIPNETRRRAMGQALDETTCLKFNTYHFRNSIPWDSAHIKGAKIVVCDGGGSDAMTRVMERPTLASAKKALSEAYPSTELVSDIVIDVYIQWDNESVSHYELG